jgi:CRP-like cAMP-binding protein
VGQSSRDSRAPVARGAGLRYVIELKHARPIVSAASGGIRMALANRLKFDFKILDRPDMPVRTIAAGENIVVEGSPGTEMFLIRKGGARVFVKGERVDDLEVGDIFGEMALIDQSPRGATVTAVEDCDVIPIDERLFIILVQNSPYFGIEVMRILASRLRAMNEVV